METGSQGSALRSHSINLLHAAHDPTPGGAAPAAGAPRPASSALSERWQHAVCAMHERRQGELMKQERARRATCGESRKSVVAVGWLLALVVGWSGADGIVMLLSQPVAELPRNVAETMRERSLDRRCYFHVEVRFRVRVLEQGEPSSPHHAAMSTSNRLRVDGGGELLVCANYKSKHCPRQCLYRYLLRIATIALKSFARFAFTGARVNASVDGAS